jgi:hypothetical protein
MAMQSGGAPEFTKLSNSARDAFRLCEKTRVPLQCRIERDGLGVRALARQ